MDSEQLNRLSERAGSRYGLLLEGFRSAFIVALQVSPWAQKTADTMRAKAYDLANAWLSDETSTIDQELAAQAQLAANDVSDDLGLLHKTMSADVSNNTDAIATALENAVRLQIERDIAVLTNALRQVALRVTIKARAQAVNFEAVLPAIRQDAIQRLSFEFSDRSGKRWPSQRSFKTVWRQALVLAYNESVMIDVADHGIDYVVIEHPDQSHNEQSTKISLIEGSSDVIWPEIVSDVFHPNTHAYLRVPEEYRN